MDFELIDRREEAAAPEFSREANRLATGALRTVWDFAAQQPSHIYLLADFVEERYHPLLALQGRLWEVPELSQVPRQRFDVSPERVAKLEGFLKGDFARLEKLYDVYGRLVPHRLYLGFVGETKALAVSMDYTPTLDALLPFDEALASWRGEVEAGLWPPYPV